MRKNKMMRLASGLLVAVLLTTCVISGTFAKYISEKTGTSTAAQVAKWSFEVNDADITTADTFTFDLFGAIKDSDGSTEEDVKATLIAPGTSGQVAIVLENTSEVDAKYAVVFGATQTNTPDGKPIPIEYCLDPEAQTPVWTKDITTLNIPDTNTELVKETGTATVNVYWRWVYSTGEAGDAIDTAIGVQAQNANKPQVVVTATVTATQVD